MYAVTGITGQVGGATGRSLLNAGLSVRAVVRDAPKGAPWKQRGCEVAVADMNDVPALTAAFTDTSGVFVMIPANYDPEPGFPEVRAIATTLASAVRAAKPPKVVLLSTIGAVAMQPTLLSQLGLVEQALGALGMPVCFLRPSWFMENSTWDVESARDKGVISSFLQPLDKTVPMVATADVGRVAAELLQETWTGQRIIELEGPVSVTPNQLAATFAELFGHPVRAEAVPRQTWEQLFKSQGMKYPEPRIQMLDGYNQGWIEFDKNEAVRKGQIALKEVLKGLIGGK